MEKKTADAAASKIEEKTTDEAAVKKKEKDVRDVFNRLDQNKDSKIDRVELAKVLRKLDPETWTEKKADELFEAIDANSDNEIGFNEFLEWAFSPNDSLFWTLVKQLKRGEVPDADHELSLLCEQLEMDASLRNDGDWDDDEDELPGLDELKPKLTASGKGKLAWGSFSLSRGPGGGIKALSLSITAATTTPPTLSMSSTFSEMTARGPGLNDTQSARGSIHGRDFTWLRGEELGRGTMGTVYKALDQKSGEIIAVKQVDESDEKFTAALENELDICSALRHPCIVSLLGHDRLDGSLFLYLEFMPGGSLSEVLSQFGKLEESLVSEYTRSVTKGLNYLHEQEPKVLHRDIKGGNVLLGLNCEAKLADFGCSKRVDGSLAHTMRGSVPWMAPEVIMRSGYGRRADIWSLGCLVIEMATAASPWGKLDNLLFALRKIGMSSELPPMPESLSPEGKEFISKCVIRNPTERWRASDALRHSFLREDVTLENVDG
eukprot:TRINITY_DN64183_c0_g1_i1.p1 TRINITY_DN64183_c0_g1~~TRINITY_DN64183_c0_g1_i1.p1  ORF type:complete len:491 (+),score=115.65 TRINITY_DN64183_c0_g1_i1:40-1512(+)